MKLTKRDVLAWIDFQIIDNQNSVEFAEKHLTNGESRKRQQAVELFKQLRQIINQWDGRNR